MHTVACDPYNKIDLEECFLSESSNSLDSFPGTLLDEHDYSGDEDDFEDFCE
jgi:hypothetical protein